MNKDTTATELFLSILESMDEQGVDEAYITFATNSGAIVRFRIALDEVIEAPTRH